MTTMIYTERHKIGPKYVLRLSQTQCNIYDSSQASAERPRTRNDLVLLVLVLSQNWTYLILNRGRPQFGTVPAKVRSVLAGLILGSESNQWYSVG